MTMKKPNAENDDHLSPEELRSLVAQFKGGKQAVSNRLGFSRRQLDNYLTGHTPIPYCVGYAVRALVNAR